MEFFALKCSKQVLLAVSMFQFSKHKGGKKLGFSSRELGKLGELSAKLILGVNYFGGFESYLDVFSEFLMLIYEMEIGKDEISVRADFKNSIALELRNMLAISMENRKYSF